LLLDIVSLLSVRVRLGKWQRLLLERLSCPRVEDVCHERHPFLGGTFEVVLDRSVFECYKIMLFAIW
jgi:hypothetical protein